MSCKLDNKEVLIRIELALISILRANPSGVNKKKGCKSIKIVINC